jgi:Cu+-exporting ATPase
MQQTAELTKCFHCGADCENEQVKLDDKQFCCMGCKTVYEILQANDMQQYYAMNLAPGQSRRNKKQKDFAFLANEDIRQRLLDFSDDGISVIRLYLPQIHCSSCIWLLENLGKLKKGIISVVVNFPRRTARITFKEADISLKDVAELLSAIGYEPLISLEDTERKRETKDRSLLYKFGVAAFAFGNVMIMALPEYFDYTDATLQTFLPFFRWLMLALSVPVVVYSANDYFISAYKGLKHRYMNIDVPIALGISVLFLRSAYDVITQSGPGYFDSLTGLVFFLLLGKFFQRKTYESLSFDRDYKSYFPVAVTRLGEVEDTIPVNDLKTGDRILIRNEELIPADCILLKGEALIDNSFVTGEATPVKKQSGDRIFAGGKQLGEAIELEVIKPVEQSYLTQLWNHEVFSSGKELDFKNLTDRISKYFTVAILIIATAAATYWYVVEPAKAITVFTAILIVACPCALALSAPFTHGNVLRILGRNRFFVKDANAIERMAEINHVVWDKTGTLTVSRGTHLSYSGDPLTREDRIAVKSLARQSNHPLSRLLYNHMQEEIAQITNFREDAGQGSEGLINDVNYRLGAAAWTFGNGAANRLNETRVYVARNEKQLGFFKVENAYRPGVFELIRRLAGDFKQSLLSGDRAGEKDVLQPVFGTNAHLYFNQKPDDKLALIEKLQEKKQRILMIGDGLNDAGALRKSDVGISLSEDVNTFSPACDAILDATELTRLDTFLQFSRSAKRIIIASFALSFTYNLVGLSFAAAGLLSPVVSAILMPLSSITIVVFVTVVSNIIGRRFGL